ncbi:MAG: hypothetical protein HOE86_00835, partial [Gemmatimonadetes bacterium]|nr:hypothetical protein [Gemmatimonadota bacterium]
MSESTIIASMSRIYANLSDHQFELLEKLAALVPPPRLNLVRYHGVLAPACPDRAQIVPGRSAL